jgi:ferredoxin
LPERRLVPFLLQFAVLTMAALILAGGGWFAISSWREQEPRATAVASLGAVLLALPFLVVALTSIPGRNAIAFALLSATALTVLACFWPDRRSSLPARIGATERIDERDILFSRKELRPGTKRFETYYARNPEHLEPDDRWRRKPGLMSPAARYAHDVGFAASDGSFTAVEALQDLVDGEPAAQRVVRSPEDFRDFLCGWARLLGAADAGTTTLEPGHVYTVGGRRERYDEPIELDHPFAVAFTVEMDHRMMQSAPDAPTLMESARQYLNAGSIAVQLAVAIRQLGYRARAHIDANYQVICPLVARDAGLGEIGRMGLLMTPTSGPRVRIGVVTTDMPLALTEYGPDPTVEEFCRLCEKCAKVCPSQAIPYGDRGSRWKIDSESCFTYWCESGTDCGRCVITCPYAHPDTGVHRLVRAAIRRSPLLRRLATPLDDLAYGTRPRPHPVPEWMERQ